jgi:hypothetical protein
MAGIIHRIFAVEDFDRVISCYLITLVFSKLGKPDGKHPSDTLKAQVSSPDKMRSGTRGIFRTSTAHSVPWKIIA